MQLSLEPKILAHLKQNKNLLAFSGGVDSSALFFLLLERGVVFDIAIVDYATRQESKDEVAYAKELAQKHNLTCYVHQAAKIEKNFEAKAREMRYAFFEDLVAKHNYQNLLTAHHLGDRLEWFLMQLSKGAGLLELVGMQTFEPKNGYTLIRPLLGFSKDELKDYLDSSFLKYFIDSTNSDEKYRRNYFRNNFSNPLLKEFLGGIKRSFEYMQEDRELLLDKDVKIEHIEDFTYIEAKPFTRQGIYHIDKQLKTRGFMLSFTQKEQLKHKASVQIARQLIVNQDKRGFIFIVPYKRVKPPLPKEFKEECRVLKLEPSIRYYLYENRDIFLLIKGLLG